MKALLPHSRRSALLVAALLASCAHRPKTQELVFEPLAIVGEPELMNLTPAELYERGRARLAAGEYAEAERFFSRLMEFHKESPEWRGAVRSSAEGFAREKDWPAAYARAMELADPAKGTDEALETSFQAVEALFHMGRLDEAREILATLQGRSDLSPSQMLKARVQAGVVEADRGDAARAEQYLRAALDGAPLIISREDQYFLGQAEFFLGELAKRTFEATPLPAVDAAEALADALEQKSQRLLAAEEHYVSAARKGNPHWATAAGERVGRLYEELYDELITLPPPKELAAAAKPEYERAVRERARVLLEKALATQEVVLEAANRTGSESAFVDAAKERINRVRARLDASP